MKIRTVYFKVTNMERSLDFWKKFLGTDPNKSSANWSEFKIGDVRLGFLLNDFDDKFSGSSCVPVFELSDDEITDWAQKAKDLGAELVFDSLADQKSLSIVFIDPSGHEFELTKFHE